MTRKTLILSLRAAAGLLLLALLLAWIGIAPLLQALRGFDPLFYLLALAMLGLHFLFHSIALRLLLRRKGLDVRVRHIFRLTLISHFFGVFLPGGIGPDMVLCYNIARSTEKKEDALSAVLFSRIAVLFLMSLTAFAGSFHPLAARHGLRLPTGLILAAFLAAFFFMAHRDALRATRRLLEFLNRYRFTAFLYKLYFAVASRTGDRRLLLRIAPLLLGSALVKITTDYVIARALGLDIPLLYFVVFIPMVTVLSAFPISFAGLGVREGSFVGLFALAGVPAEQALAVSLLSFSMVLVTAAVGAVLYVFHGTSLITRDS